MQVDHPCDWILDRLRRKKPFFAVRINDGEMIQILRTRPEGTLLGTVVNPVWTNYECGNAYRSMLEEMSRLTAEQRDNVLIGCSWNTDRADDMGRGPFAELIRSLDLENANWCHEHWPLEGVINGGTIRMLEELRNHPTVLVTCKEIMDVNRCLLGKGPAHGVLSSSQDSWQDRDLVEVAVRPPVKRGYVTLWAGGCGLKPSAWKLWREFPGSRHIDVGHLFNGAMGLRDYGWLERGDGPWHEPYFRAGGFRDWVRTRMTR